MSLIKHHKKFIALFVVLSFLYLVEISYLPLRAEPAPAKAPVSMNGDDQTPGSIEQEGGGYVHKKKSSPILPIIIGVVVLGAVAAVLILVVFKSSYNIAGSWSLRESYTNGANFTDTFTFAATTKNKNGTYTTAGGDHGNWTQDKKAVHIVSTYYTLQIYDGNFTGKKAMSGTCRCLFNSGIVYDGTWSATKISSSSVAVYASVPADPAKQKQTKKN